ncbi:hypothetical protein D0Z07_7504, partial [Hyphodiscus hymeniophilus]
TPLRKVGFIANSVGVTSRSSAESTWHVILALIQKRNMSVKFARRSSLEGRPREDLAPRLTVSSVILAFMEKLSERIRQTGASEHPCSRCNKKGIDCHYERNDLENQKEGSKSTTPPSVLYGYQASREGDDTNLTSNPDYETAKVSGNKDMENQASFEERLSAALNRNKGPIDWTSVRVQNDSLESSNLSDAPYGVPQSTSEDDIWPSIPVAEQTKFVKSYFAHFHHRWPILHAPIFTIESAPPVLRSCVIMIGACIYGTDGSKQLASSLHGRVYGYIFPRLGQLSSEDSLDHLSTRALIEATLLYIIFGFYCGKESILSKSILARALLITALREMGLFKAELPVSYDKPGYFLPLRLARDAQRQRISTCLFKIDSYLALLRGQPQLLTPEELHFTLPSTFALWNADGLHIWETRHSIEPQARRQTTICQIICEPALETYSSVDGLMLVEDIQLGICAMHSKIWHLRELSRDNTGQEISNAIERDWLKRRLDAWKQLMGRIPLQQTDYIDFSQEQHLAMRYYYGCEDHSIPGWQLTVFDRPKNLIFDTIILYHLLSIHVSADIRILTQLAKDKHPGDSVKNEGEKYLKGKEQREASTRAWVKSASVRRALTHATDILVSYNNVSGLQNSHVDPIVFIALSVSALIVWAYCMHGGEGCPDCLSGEQDLPFLDTPVVELTKWSGPNTCQVFEKDRETWIERGGCRGALAGLNLCRCNVDLLMAKFRRCIRQGWNVADTIAPGIFNSLS